MPWTCFLLAQTNRFRRTLRNYSDPNKRTCPGPLGYHQASAVLPGFVEMESEYMGQGLIADEAARQHPANPKRCAHCGYEFQPEDDWRDDYDRLVVAPDGTEYSLRGEGKLPPGAVYVYPRKESAFWACTGTWNGGEVHLALPGGDFWLVTGPSTNGTGWQVDGSDPTKLTVNPSIKTPRYHGWLRDGVLSDDTDGRMY